MFLTSLLKSSGLRAAGHSARLGAAAAALLCALIMSGCGPKQFGTVEFAGATLPRFSQVEPVREKETVGLRTQEILKLPGTKMERLDAYWKQLEEKGWKLQNEITEVTRLTRNYRREASEELIAEFAGSMGLRLSWTKAAPAPPKPAPTPAVAAGAATGAPGAR